MSLGGRSCGYSIITLRVIFIDDLPGANAIGPVLEGITRLLLRSQLSANGASGTGGVPLVADTSGLCTSTCSTFAFLAYLVTFKIPLHPELGRFRGT